MRDLFTSFSAAAEAFHDARTALATELKDLGLHDLTPERALIMVSLAGGQQTVQQISRNAYFGSNVSYNIAALEKSGYAELVENAQDRRSKFVRLTVAGRDVLNRLNAHRTERAAPIAA
ncbi:winged helix DNA-binding protein [Azospirillum sp. TSA2s]|uniref:winged helix DNA-binding protein n=1 Tax=Azospirillum sp. TSA2s TaxID=709810 RepID=UPI00145A0A7B|nr:winged helix DNA-binding protein [Azospirillum sp. TSA2s]